MIAARTLKSKEAIDELIDSGEDMEDIEIAASNAEKALNSIGLTARTQTGDFKDLEVILGEVAGKWDTLSDATKQYVSEQMAGNNRRSFFIGLMENYDRTMELQRLAEESSGQLMEASEKKANSLEGQLNRLQNAWANLYQAMLNSDFTKGAVSGLTNLINSIGAVTRVIKPVLIPALGAATGAMIAFNIATKGFSGSIAGQFIDKIYNMGKSLGTLATTLGTTKLAMIGLSGVVGGIALTAIAHFIKKGQEKKEMLEGMTQAMDDYKQASERTTEVDQAVSDYERLHQELRDMNTTEERRQEIEQEIANIRELLGTDERYKKILEQENALISDQLADIKEINEIDSRNDAIDAYEKTDLDDGDITDIQDRITNRQSYIQRLDSDIVSFNQSLADAEQRLKNAGENTREWEEAQKDINYYTGLITDSEIERAKAEEEITEKIKQIVAYQEAGIALGKEGFTNDRDAMEIIKQLAPLYEQITGEKLDLVALSGEELETEKQITEEKEKQSGISDSTAEDETEALVARQKELNEQYVESLNSMEEIAELTERIQDGLSLEDMNTLLNSDLMDGFTGSIDNAADVTEHLKGKLQEMQDKAYETYANMQLADKEYWNSAVRECARALGVNEDEFVNYINSKGLARNVDVNNATSAANAELQTNISLINQLLTGYAGVTNDKAGYRKVDMGNVVKFLNAQGQKEGMTVDQLTTIWANFYSAKKKAIQAELADLKKQSNAMQGFAGDPTVKVDMDRLNAEMAGLEAANSMIGNYFSGVNTTFNNITNGLSQAAANAGKAIGNALKPSSGSGSSSSSKPSGSGGSGSGGSGSGGSSTQREVADMEDLVDRYYQLNDAIRNVTKALEKNRQAQANVKSKADYKKLVQEEINLINKEITAMQNLQKEQQKERDELKATLRQNGFAFDGNNNITNYASRLRQMTNYANSLSNPDQKEAAIAHVKAIDDIIKRYTELEDTTIPSTSQSIEDLKNEIIDINKEFEENMKLIEALGDRYFDLMRKIGKLDNALALNQAKQENATERERLELIAQEIDLLLKRQQLVKEQRDEVTKEANEVKKQLTGKGVKFDAKGTITNYKTLVQALENKANGLVGDAQDDAVEDAQEILDLIDKYVTLTEETLPNLEVEWEKYTGQIQDSKDAIDEIFRSFRDTVVGVQKDIASAYEKYQTERYNKLQEALNKEKELYDKAYEEENFDRNLSEQQRELAEIAQQIAIYSRDTSEAGKARLEQLRQEYEDQQQAINDLIRDKEKSNADDRFEQETDKLNKELEDLLAPEKLVSVVNDAIASGMITIGEETMKLDTVMTNWLNDTGDGLYALGDILQKELIENLQEAQKIIGEINVNGFKAPKANVPTSNQAIQDAINSLKTKSVGDVNFSLTVEGDVTDNNLPKLEKQLGDMEQRIYNTIAKSMR